MVIIPGIVGCEAVWVCCRHTGLWREDGRPPEVLDTAPMRWHVGVLSRLEPVEERQHTLGEQRCRSGVVRRE
ncbi:MAG: hypothetical protein QOD52_1651 [Gaiellaceae bacterium]|jgi:hypothetical protein|nr:hypothetical protein [Gaiellaceae bacterium]